MDLYAPALLVGLTLMGVAYAVLIFPRWWRGTLPFLGSEHVPGAWPFGDALYRGWTRLGTVFLVLAASAAWFLPATVLWPDEQSLRNEAPVWYRIVGLILAGSWLVLVFSVVLLNRPKSVVPPHLREQAGALEEWTRSLINRLAGRKQG